MAIITLAMYKALAGIKDTERDAQIEALIPMVEEDFLMIRNKPFGKKPDKSIMYPQGATFAAAEMISYKLQSLRGNVGTASEGAGKYSHTYDPARSRGYPDYIVQKIRSYASAR